MEKVLAFKQMHTSTTLKHRAQNKIQSRNIVSLVEVHIQHFNTPKPASTQWDKSIFM